MEACCDLEVDVNGEESFMVNKGVIASYSGKLSNLLGKSRGSTRNLKVVFHEFPGGAESFELISRFCFNIGSFDITPSNICLLHFAALFMEIKSSVNGAHNLLEKTEKSLEEMRYWTWSELLVVLKQCQDLVPVANSLPLLEKCLDCIVGSLALSSEASPCPSTSSPDSSGIRFSCDTKSTESLKTNSSRTKWWFEDLLVLGLNAVEMLVKAMVSQKFDHVTISRFLFYYQKSKFYTVKSDAKRTIAETVIDMLYILDHSCLSCKSLFAIVRVIQNLNVKKSSRNKLESMIDSQLDQASLDNLLVLSPHGINHLYDVNLVIRLLNSFLSGGTAEASPMKLRKVGVLVDLYIAEVAPDPCLKSSKFLALAMVLPDAARDSCDELYRAIDMYLEVHGGLSEEEKMKLCCVLNYSKISEEACLHLFQNAKFPSKSAVQTLVSQQFKLKSLVHATYNSKSSCNSPFSATEVGKEGRIGHDSNEQRILYAGKSISQLTTRSSENIYMACSGGPWSWRKCARKYKPKWQSSQSQEWYQARVIQDPCPSFVHDSKVCSHSIFLILMLLVTIYLISV